MDVQVGWTIMANYKATYDRKTVEKDFTRVERFSARDEAEAAEIAQRRLLAHEKIIGIVLDESSAVSIEQAVVGGGDASG